MGVLHLRTTATQLTEVVVTAERSVVSGGLDKRVVDVTKDLTMTVGTAIDVPTASYFKRESRITFLGFTYRFGQNQDSRAKRKADQDEGGGFE